VAGEGGEAREAVEAGEQPGNANCASVGYLDTN
jgi:hypothetical protein